MSTYLLDSNVLSEPLRPRPNAHLLKQLKANSEQLVTTSVVWHELWFGVERLPPSRKRTAIEAYLRDVVAPTIPILPYDDFAARWHGRARAQLRAQGLTPPFRDGQIAAVAYVRDLVVVTANTSDFAKMPGIEVVNWLG